MNAKDEIKELFSEKLGNYEANVNPQLWGNIASQVGASAAAGAGSTGLSLLTKILIGAGAASVITVGTILAVSSSEDTDKPAEEKNNVALVESSQEQAQDKNETQTLESDSETENVIINPDDNQDSRENQSVTQETFEGVIPGNGSFPVEGAEVLTQQDNILREEVKQNNVQQHEESSSNKQEEEQQSSQQEEKNTKVEQNTTEDTGNENIEEQEVDTKTIVTREIKLPNVFTPNGDGVNEELYLLDTEGLADFNIVVLDERYNKVFESKNPEFRWNGINMVTNQPLEEGRYTALITGKDEHGNPIKAKYYPFEIIK